MADDFYARLLVWDEDSEEMLENIRVSIDVSGALSAGADDPPRVVVELGDVIFAFRFIDMLNEFLEVSDYQNPEDVRAMKQWLDTFESAIPRLKEWLSNA